MTVTASPRRGGLSPSAKSPRPGLKRGVKSYLKPQSQSNPPLLLSSFLNFYRTSESQDHLSDLARSGACPLPKWPKHLVIVRHAESERNVWKDIATAKGDFIYGGETRDIDVGLTETGERQAAATGKALGEQFQFNCLFVSPFRRTIHTAQILVEQFPYPLTLIEDDRLREIDFGVLDGLTKHGIAHFQSGEMQRRARLGKYHHRPPGGENYPDVALRLHSFLGTLTRETAGKSVLVVCHSVVVLIFRKLLERLLEKQILAIDSDKTQEVQNCSVTHYAFDANTGTQGKLVLQDFNRIYY